MAIVPQVSEYLKAGVRAVCVIDDASQTALIYRPDQPPEQVRLGEILRVPEVLGELSVPLAELLQ